MTSDMENHFRDVRVEVTTYHNLSFVTPSVGGEMFAFFSFLGGLSWSFVAAFPARDGNICSICALPRLPKIKTVCHLADHVEPHLPTLPKFFQ